MSKTKKIKMLKNVASPAGVYEAGKVYEVDESLAKNLCAPIKYADRNELFVKAIEVVEHVEKEGEPGEVKIAVKELTVGDMVGLGVKNIVKTPEDPKYTEYLKKVGAMPSDSESAKNRKNRLEQRLASAQSPE